VGLEISLAPGFSQVITVLEEIENRFNGFCLRIEYHLAQAMC